tara:strand:- start:392 stop:673 length:282 start_codon:yes stop_codon:yes gene_type:complete
MTKEKIDFNELQRSVEELKFKTVQDSNSFEDKVIYLLDKLILLILQSSSISNNELGIQEKFLEIVKDQRDINKDCEKRIQKLELKIQQLEEKQ